MNSMISVRVWGEFACFTRPEMKVERVSYRVPTPSAARGILEAIFWEPEMYYLIGSITVVRPGRWFTFQRNEVEKVISIKRAKSWMMGKEIAEPIKAGAGGDDLAQRNMLALADVEYVLTAEVRLTAKHDPRRDNVPKYVDQVMSRTAKGKCAHRPALGCREFAADFELVENPPVVANGLTEDLGVMLYDVFDPVDRAMQRSVIPRPVFFRAKIENGQMDCHPDRINGNLIRPGTRRT
jgi:CRISPR-associated protein Cas5d